MIAFARRQPGCRALQADHYGVGWLCTVIIWAEIGDARRFRSSDQVVRFAGLDITVYSSDGKRSPGHLSWQGSPELRWAAFEADRCAAHRGSPDYAYLHTVAAVLDGKRPALAVERKLLRRRYHTLRELGEVAMAPGSSPVDPDKVGRGHAPPHTGAPDQNTGRRPRLEPTCLPSSVRALSTRRILAGIKVVRPRCAVGAPP